MPRPVYILGRTRQRIALVVTIHLTGRPDALLEVPYPMHGHAIGRGPKYQEIHAAGVWAYEGAGLAARELPH
jgi:hypothetical protein